MAQKQHNNKGDQSNKKQNGKQRWNETELRLITGASTLAAAFLISQITGISHEVFYGSFQRYISGFFVLMLLYLLIYAFLYRKNKG